MIELGDNVIAVLATAGDNHPGGDDFDERIVDYLVKTNCENFLTGSVTVAFVMVMPVFMVMIRMVMMVNVLFAVIVSVERFDIVKMRSHLISIRKS